MEGLSTVTSSRRLRARVAVFLIVCGDIAALLGALFLSLQLRFDSTPFVQILDDYIRHHLFSLPFILALYVALFAAFRLYRYAWRFASLETLWGVVAANTVGLAGLIWAQYAVDGQTLPRSVLAIFWMTSIALVGGVRIALRLASLGHSYGRRAIKLIKSDVRPRRVVILGAGSTGVRVLTTVQGELKRQYDPIGFLDDNPDKKGAYIRGIKVLGPLDHLYRLLADRAVDEVLIAIPESSGAAIRQYVMACRKQSVTVRVIPAIQDVLNGTAVVRMEEIGVEDLLRRPPVRTDLAGIGSYLTGKRVLLTGAGGSIGFELCRQIAALKPSKLILFGHGENSIHLVQEELQAGWPELASCLVAAIGSVTDESRVDQVFSAYSPEVVFHAAAHKHVPIMETNVSEAVQNNVLGTSCIAEACGRYRVSRMVLISTDKAVYPTSVMGATKWMCEEVIRAAASIHPRTTYVTVRFGNVLGSRGSVVRIFHKQIQKGGPVLVTHPEMTRYFMSIPEAVQLVLQAGAIGASGDLYLLDMGDPVRIVDLACDMIRLCGREPNVDIPIIFTGPRPGEKLCENLTTEDERSQPSNCEGLSIVERPNYYSPVEIAGILRRMHLILDQGDDEEMRELLGEVVPGFTQPAATQEVVHVRDADR